MTQPDKQEQKGRIVASIKTSMSTPQELMERMARKKQELDELYDGVGGKYNIHDTTCKKLSIVEAKVDIVSSQVQSLHSGIRAQGDKLQALSNKLDEMLKKLGAGD